MKDQTMNLQKLLEKEGLKINQSDLALVAKQFKDIDDPKLLDTVIKLIASMRPKNGMAVLLAIQAVHLHIIQCRLLDHAGKFAKRFSGSDYNLLTNTATKLSNATTNLATAFDKINNSYEENKKNEGDTP